jgi:glycosyltransferase involved in cell wall biosynthesis/ADP-heptose:LPS heptosyltransferase
MSPRKASKKSTSTKSKATPKSKPNSKWSTKKMAARPAKKATPPKGTKAKAAASRIARAARPAARPFSPAVSTPEANALAMTAAGFPLTLPSCPVCTSPAFQRYATSPYWMCPSCDCWFQSPMPPKTYEASHEKDANGGFTGHLMTDHDKDVNRGLANALFRDWLHSAPAKTLDIGSKYPFLASCLKGFGCDAFGMDNIEIVPEYSRELDIPMLMADFEAISEDQIVEWTKVEKFSLITMVHVFEHMYEPLEALRKLRRLIADDGTLFIRLPDHGVSGFERDLTLGHYTIHPFFHSIGSLLELLVRGQDLFTVQRTNPMHGSGQRDLILKPLLRKPVIYAGMIAKNEERDLPRCLRSIESLVDGVVLVDTGSTDATLSIAESTITKPVFTQTYTGASRQDDTGDWKIWDFGKARNVFVQEIDQRDVDYLLWMDADDELLTPANLRRAVYWSEFDVFGVQITSGGDRWIHHRLWKTKRDVHYEGRCHEYPTIGALPSISLSDSVIRHHQEPGTGENSNARNLRILLEEFEEDPKPRTAFYLANTHKDGERYVEAVPWYEKRIAFGGEGFRDEFLFAHLFKMRCQRFAKDFAGARISALRAIAIEPSWSEFWMELSYGAYDQHAYEDAIGYSLVAYDKPQPPTPLWRESNKYTDQPLRIISWCHEHLGDNRNALTWAERARTRIGGRDEEWEKRIAQLQRNLGIAATPPARARSRDRGARTRATRPSAASDAESEGARSAQDKAPATVTKRPIALYRPGAIGDVLMTLNLVPALRKQWPGHAIHYYCHPSIGTPLRALMNAAGVDVIGDSTVVEASQLAHDHARVFNLIGYPLHEGYPEKPMRKHLIDFFADELGVTEHSPLEVQRPARFTSIPLRYATLQVKTGWSAYKNWPIERWRDVVKACPEIPIYQIGTDDEPRVEGAYHDFLGAPLQESIALVANASLHLGLDSFANHLTNYWWRWRDGDRANLPTVVHWWRDGDHLTRVPAVILWGSTQESASGYEHNTNISLGLSCQPCFREDPSISRMSRGPCINPLGQIYAKPEHACMFGIDVERVTRAVKTHWSTEGTER